MSFRYHAHLMAYFQLVGKARAPMLKHFVVRSESHNQITNDWSVGFYALITSAHSAESYDVAVRTLRKSTRALMPSVVDLVKWGVPND